MREGFGVILLLAVGLVVLVAIGIAAEVGYLGVKPWIVRQDTRIIRQSNGYVTSHQQALETMRADYDGLGVRLAEVGDGNPQLSDALRSQQAGLRRQMQAEAALIPDDVPADIRPLLTRSY